MTDKINGIKGWFFTQEEIDRANKDNFLLTLDFEYGDRCGLNCIYCYRTEDSRDNLNDLLNFDQWKRIIDESAELGLKSVKLIGGGEITEEKNFIEAMEYIANKGIIIVLFTSGMVLGDDERCKRILKIGSKQLANWMNNLGMSVFLKVDSFNNELQDKIVGRTGYAKMRDNALELLLKLGFAESNPTRLGLEVNVSRHNYSEIMEIYALRKKYNIYEDVVISMPCDAYFKNKDYDITIEQKREIFQNIYAFNKENNIQFDNISPFIGGLSCSQLGNGLYITNRGKVFHCPGSFNMIGDTKKESLKSIWQNFKEKNKYREHYFCPFREETNIIPTYLVKTLQNELLINSNVSVDIK